jgi:hypothetical protein
MDNQDQKGAIMNTRMKTDTWIYYIFVVLGLIATVSAIGTVILVLMSEPVSKLIIALGSVAFVGLVRLLIPPLNQVWLE